MIHQLHRHRRYAIEMRNALCLDQPERRIDVPLVHHDDLAPDAERQQKQAVQAGHVEKGHGEQNPWLLLGLLTHCAGHHRSRCTNHQPRTEGRQHIALR